MLACPDQGGLNLRFERVDFHETTTDGHYVPHTIAMEREIGLLTQSMLEFSVSSSDHKTSSWVRPPVTGAQSSRGSSYITTLQKLVAFLPETFMSL